MSYILDGGWFDTVNGVRVRKIDMTHIDHTRYWDGAPRGLMWHYTAGCGSNLEGVIRDRGYNICTFSIDRDGVIYEYLPVEYAAWHAYDASYNYVGVEHSGLPGTCNLTPAQHDSSVALFAAVIEWIKKKYGLVVPVEHVMGCTLDRAGLKEHADGIGCSWNPKTHTDGLNPAGWSWGTYLKDISDMLGAKPPEEGVFMALSDEEQAKLYGITWWTMRGTQNMPAPTKDQGKIDGIDVYDQISNAWESGQIVRKAAGLGTIKKF